MTLTNNSGGLQQLASSSLPTLNANPFQPSWSRSLSELYAANQSLVKDATPQPTAAAQTLLGSSRTDFTSLARSLAPKPTRPSSSSLMSIEDKCRQHRDGILERILQNEREHSHRAFEKSIEERRENDWAQERQWWMQEIVGKRNVVNPSTAHIPSSSTTLATPVLTGPNYPMSSNLLPGYASRVNQTLDTKLALDHARVLQADPQDWVALLQQSAQDSGYATAWHLLGCIVPRLDNAIDGARGALIHLCRQYQVVVKTRVASANLDRRIGSRGMAGMVGDYCQLEKGSRASIWDSLYYCLRCGDAIAAGEVLNARTDHFPEQGLIQAVLVNLAHIQRDASCVWEAGSVFPTQHRASLVDMYQKTCNLEPDNKSKIGVVALLSGQQLYSSETIEDYLFGLLWAALQSDNPLPAVEQIGASIRKYGPDHFGGPEENGGWGYALPLLATQQFQTALTFLAQAGGTTGLLQATHLGLVLSTAGVPLLDLGPSSSSSSNYIVTALLVKYASYLEQDPSLGVGKALEYLTKIPSKEQSLKEIAALVCRSSYFIDQLAGTMKDDGSRQQGELDKYMDREDVAAVLTKAAETFRRGAQKDRAQAELAAKLFMLAGKYRSLLSLLNDLITPTDKDDDDKRHWWTQSEQFYTHYLAQRSLALSSLESENSTKLVTTNRTLMELRHVFATLRQEKHQEAFDIIKRMQLLPLTQEEISERESKYKDLDTIVKDQFPALVTGAVYALYGLHRRIKSEARGVDDSVNFHLKDLQNKARFLYVFSGLTGMPSATKEEIQRLRNNMI